MPRRAARWIMLVLMGLGVMGAVWLLVRRHLVAHAEKEGDPELLASIGPRQIRVPDFVRERARRGGAHPEQLDKSALLDEMILREALMVKALQTGLDRDPVLVREWQNLVIGRLQQKELEPRLARIVVADAEMQVYYRQNQARYTQPAKRRLAIIFVATKPKMNDTELASCQARIGALRQQALAQAGEPAAKGFGALAAESSEDQATRYKGGDIGWLEEGREKYAWETAVVAAGFAIGTSGGISDAVRTERGWYLVKLVDRREAEITPFEQVTEAIRQKLRREKQQEVEQAFRNEVRQAARIEIYRTVLEHIPPPPTRATPEEPPELLQ